MTGWPKTERHAAVELVVVCNGRGSHSHPPRRLHHLVLHPVLPDGTAASGMYQVPTQQQRAGKAVATVHPVNSHGVLVAKCPVCGVDVQRRKEAVEDLLQRLADNDATRGRVITLSPEALLA